MYLQNGREPTAFVFRGRPEFGQRSFEIGYASFQLHLTCNVLERAEPEHDLPVYPLGSGATAYPVPMTRRPLDPEGGFKQFSLGRACPGPGYVLREQDGRHVMHLHGVALVEIYAVGNVWIVEMRILGPDVEFQRGGGSLPGACPGLDDDEGAASSRGTGARGGPNLGGDVVWQAASRTAGRSHNRGCPSDDLDPFKIQRAGAGDDPCLRNCASSSSTRASSRWVWLISVNTPNHRITSPSSM